MARVSPFRESSVWRLEEFEPRLLLSVTLGSSAAVTAIAQPTAIVQGVCLDANSPPAGSFTPAQIRSAYGFDQVSFGAVAGDGSGQTVAVIDAYDDPVALNDLNMFSSQFGLPQFNVSGGPAFSQVGQTGGALPGTDPAGPNNGTTWEVEESQDIEWVHAIAPRANIMLVEANSASLSDLVQGAGWAADQPGVVVVSMSFSGPEFSTELSSDMDFAFITQFGHPGVTFLAASGDYGQPAGYPACSPNVVSVGGTSLTLAPDGSTYSSETGWSRSGGGISLYESQPSYQKGVVTQSTTMRTAPDVAMDADPATGVACYDSYDDPGAPWRNVAGTSLSTAMWAGLIAVADQGRALGGVDSLNGLYQTLPDLYKLPAADFNDITTGSNGYSAGAGYDLVTGLGTPVANRLIPDLAGIPSKLAFTKQPTSTASGTAIDPATGVQVTVEDVLGNTAAGYTSSVTLTLNGGTFASGGNTVTVATVNGIATFNNLIINAPGSYTLNAGDGILTAAASQNFAVFGAATELGFTQQPTNTLVGKVIAPAVAVAIQDPLGSTVATDGSTVTLTLSNGTFAAGGNTVTATAVHGVAIFYDLIISAAGDYTLTAGDGSLTGATSSNFSIAPPPTVLSISRQSPAGAVDEATSVTYAVTFSEPVMGVTSADFQLTFTGGTSASSTVVVWPSSGYNSVYNVTVNGIAGNGTLGLNLVDNGSVVDAYGGRLANANANGSFQAQQTFATGSQPLSIATADVNGDGKPDLIVANSADYDIGVLLGNGDGTFQTQTTVSTRQPTCAAVADLNGDGKLDMVVGNFSSSTASTVSVLLGNGDGTFQTQNQMDFAVGKNPCSIAVADVNGDGKPDLVVANMYSNTVSVLLGNGDGTFQAQKTFATGTYPHCVAVADLNGDGKLDVVAANENSVTVSVLLGNGDGTFQAQKTYTVGLFPFFVAVADVNGDGKPDLVAANKSNGTLSVLIGNGDGTFQGQKTFAVGKTPYSVAVADINGDGKPDLVAANSGNNNVSVLLGNGDGTFQGQKTFAVGSGPMFVAVADVSGDGTPDLVVANYSVTNISVLLGNNVFTGQVYTIDQPTQLAFTQPPTDTTAGKVINNSSGVQIAVEDSGGTAVSIDSSVVTLTLSGGTFADGGTTETATAVSGVARFNNLIINTAGSYTLTASDGALTGATSGSFTIYPLGDVNLDGVVNSTDIDQLYAHFGDATGRYDLNGDGAANQADVDYLVKNILHTNYGDANLDGKIDFVDFQVLLDHWQNSGASWATGDFNGDGKVDFLDFQKLLDNWNPAGFASSSQQLSLAADSSGTLADGAVAPGRASQTTAALTPVSAALAAGAASDVSGYKALAKPAASSRRFTHAAVSWTPDDGQIDLLTQLCSRPVLP